MVYSQNPNWLTLKHVTTHGLNLRILDAALGCTCSLSQWGWRLKLYYSRNQEQQPKSLRAQTPMAAVKDWQMWLRECGDLEALWSVNVQIPYNKLSKQSLWTNHFEELTLRCSPGDMERGTEVKKEMDSLFHMAKLLVIWYCKWVVKIQRRLIYLNPFFSKCELSTVRFQSRTLCLKASVLLQT